MRFRLGSKMREGKYGRKKSAGCVEWKKKHGSIFKKGAGNGRKVRKGSWQEAVESILGKEEEGE